MEGAGVLRISFLVSAHAGYKQLIAVSLSGQTACSKGNLSPFVRAHGKRRGGGEEV